MPEGKIATKTGQYYTYYRRKNVQLLGAERKKGRFLTSKSGLGRILGDFLIAGRGGRRWGAGVRGEKW